MEGRIELALAVWRQAKPYVIISSGSFVVGFLTAALVWA